MDAVILVTLLRAPNRSRQGELRGMRVEIGCQQVVLELSAYFDRELSSEWRVVIEEHLRRCRNCVAVYDGLRNLLVLVADNQKIIPLPRGFSKRLYESLQNKSIDR